MAETAKSGTSLTRSEESFVKPQESSSNPLKKLKKKFTKFRSGGNGVSLILPKCSDSYSNGVLALCYSASTLSSLKSELNKSAVGLSVNVIGFVSPVFERTPLRVFYMAGLE